MSATLQLRRNSSAGVAPTAGALSTGELVVNLADSIIYVKDSGGTVRKWSSDTTALTSNLTFASTFSIVLTGSGGAGQFVKQTTLSGALTVAALVTTDLGTGAASDATVLRGDLTWAAGVTGSWSVGGTLGVTGISTLTGGIASLQINNTGGTGHFLKQATAGGAVTSGVLVAGDVPDISSVYLPLSGGAVTGALTVGTTLGVTGNTTLSGSLTLADSKIFLNGSTTRAIQCDGAGNYTTAIGVGALQNNTTGIYNNASGYQSLYSNTTGGYNNASGYRSLFSNTTGSNNNASGYQAGYNGGVALQTLSNCSFFGYGSTASVDGITNAMALGNGASVGASNSTVIGNASVTSTVLGGGSLTVPTTVTLGGGNVTLTGAAGSLSVNKPLTIQGTTASDGPTLTPQLTSANWTSAGWTGSFAGGWVHTVGNTTALSNSFAPTVGQLYQIVVTISGRTAGSIAVAFGGYAPAATASSLNIGPRATTTGNLTITPSTDFDGTLFVQVNLISGQASPIFSGLNSSAVVCLDVRVAAGNTNVLIGRQVGQSILPPADSTAGFGAAALANLTTGASNSGFGYGALNLCTVGSQNTAIGKGSLGNCSSGSQNAATGMSSLASLTTGTNNSGFGFQALYQATTGAGNSSFGAFAGSSNGNTISNCSFFGYNSTASVDGITNAMALGNGASVGASNTTVIGNASVTSTILGGGSLTVPTTVTLGSGNVTLTGSAGLLSLNTALTMSKALTINGTTATDGPTLIAQLTSANWTSAGWAGSFAGGWVHTVGNTTALSNSVAAFTNTVYHIVTTVTGRTAGSYVITFGGYTSTAITGSLTVGPKAATTAGLTITPTTDFDGTIVVQVSINSGSSASLSLLNSSSVVCGEARIGSLASNTFYGTQSGKSVIGAVQSTGFGSLALSSLSTGSYCTAIGYNALGSCTLGTNNTAVGTTSLMTLTSGGQNTAVGHQTLLVLTTGSSNSAYGYNSLLRLTTGSNNAAFGDSTCVTVGLATLSNCTFLGCQSTSNADGYTNSTALGYQATITASNQVQIGNASVVGVTLGGASCILTVAGGVTLGSAATASSTINQIVGTSAGTVISSPAGSCFQVMVNGVSEFSVGKTAFAGTPSDGYFTLGKASSSFGYMDWGNSAGTSLSINVPGSRSALFLVSGTQVASISTAGVITTGGFTATLLSALTGGATLGVSAPATTATTGFPYIPVCAGTPTGIPTAQTGFAPMLFDSTNNKIWIYINSAWKGVVVA
jgi:hypothetical protein